MRLEINYKKQNKTPPPKRQANKQKRPYKKHKHVEAKQYATKQVMDY